MRDRLYRVEAIVLKRSDYGEADRLLTLFTPDLGKLRAIAKGARKPSSRKSGHVELFTHSALLIARGRHLDVVTQADTLDAFLPLRENLDRLGFAYYLAELVDQFVEEGDALSRGEIRDPDLDGISVTITQVKPSPDMRHATVFCEPLGGQHVKEVLAALNRHKGFIRGLMGKLITLKFTPELRFVEDTSFSEAEKIETLLKSARVARDLADGEPDEGEPGDDD